MTRLNILYPFDHNYAPFADISMTSLLENNQEADEIHIYLVGFNLTKEDLARLSATVERYHRTLHVVETAQIEKFIEKLQMPAYRGASVAAARLFISQYLNPEIGRVLYLDSDTLIVGDLSPLTTLEMHGNPVAMALDSVAREYKQYLGHAATEDYYNAGVILYDLAAWNEKQCTERILWHIQNVRKDYEALDQDLINLVLKDEILRLDARYNWQPFHVVHPARRYLRIYGTAGYYSEQELTKAAANPVIHHTFRYLGMFPWHVKSLHPGRELFDTYKAKSDWAELAPYEDYKKDWTIRVERVLYHILPKSWFLWLFRQVFRVTAKRNNRRNQAGKAYRNL